VVGREIKTNGLDGEMWSLVFLIVVFSLVFLLLFRASAQTRIDSVGVHYRYFPFVPKWRCIAWREVKQIAIKSVSPLSDFGGWGYKFGRKKRGIILTGDHAIYITQQNDKVFAITTDKPEQARHAIAHWAEEKLA
jgi:hypothetical protein